MSLTWRHLWQARKRRTSTDIRSGNFFDLQEGMVTIQYPQEVVPIPDNGRYRLHNEMDDCIVCDKCVKVCPVDCIEIEPIRAIEEVGRASDGSPIRLYAAKFDIDMAKCCYCGLCTTVCPTECLTMTKTFDYSELDVRDMVYSYANLSQEEADEKRALLEQFQKEKEALKATQKPVTASEVTPTTPAARPAFKPTIKPKPQETEAKEEAPATPAKPVFQPRKPAPVIVKTESDESQPIEEIQKSATPKLPFKPSMKPKIEKALESSNEIEPVNTETPVSETKVEPTPAKPAFRPTMKPKVEKPLESLNKAEPVNPEIPVSETIVVPTPAKPAFRPTMKPKVEKPLESLNEAEPVNPETPVSETIVELTPAKPTFRPTMKPKTDATAGNPENPVSKIPDEPIPAKPAFRPTMKPKANPSPIVEESASELKVEEITDKIEVAAKLNEDEITLEKEEAPKAKPAFRPTMKPKPKQE